MRAVCSLVAAVLLSAPLQAAAVELLLGWDARGAWDSNVFRSPSDEQDSFSLYTGPNLGLRQRRGDVRFELEYRPRYEAFVEFSDASDFEHFANARANWTLSPRTEFTASNRFSRSLSLREVIDDEVVVDPSEGDVFLEREPTLRNTTNVGANHWLSKRMQFGTNFSYQLFDFEEQGRADSSTYRGSTTLRRLLTHRQTGGFGVAASQQVFDLDPERVNTVVETFGIYEIVIDPTWTASFSGGPAWVIPDDSGPEVLVRDGNSFSESSGDEDTSLTFYGTGAIRYERAPYTFDLSYTRRASASTGAGATTNLDTVTMLASWNPDRKWRVSMRATWQKQTSAYDQLEFTGQFVGPGCGMLPGICQPVYQNVSDAVDVTSYRVNFRVSRLLTRRLQLHALASWWYQDSTGGLETTSSGNLISEPDETRDSLRFELGVSWDFDPIAL
jgi:hypothetical protein